MPSHLAPPRKETFGDQSDDERPFVSGSAPMEYKANSERRNLVVFRFPGIGFGLDDGADGFGFDGVPIAER